MGQLVCRYAEFELVAVIEDLEKQKDAFLKFFEFPTAEETAAAAGKKEHKVAAVAEVKAGAAAAAAAGAGAGGGGGGGGGGRR
jgi:uncharacterized membrane protein